MKFFVSASVGSAASRHVPTQSTAVQKPEKTAETNVSRDEGQFFPLLEIFLGFPKFKFFENGSLFKVMLK